MAMPKGYKAKNGYATVSEIGMGYREIAETLTDEGFKMNHSTARNGFLSAMQKLAKEVCNLYNVEASNEDIVKMAADPRFQQGIYGIMCDL